MYDDVEVRRREEARQHTAASLIQRRWREHAERRSLEQDAAPLRGTGGNGVLLVASDAFGDVVGRRGGETDEALRPLKSDGFDELAQTVQTPEEKRRACVEEYRALLAKRKALLENNLVYQQLLSRHYAEQRRRNGEDEVAQLTTPDAEAAYWALVRQVAEERQRVAARSTALKKDLELQRQRYEPIMEEAATQERNFQQYIQELAASVRFMRSNRPIPTEAIEKYIELEAVQRSAIHASRVRYLQLKNRLLRLRRVAKGGAALSSSAPTATAAATGQDGEESNAANHHMFLIDFEQLKVENTSLNEKIEERSEEVLKLRNKVTNTIHIATHVREKLDCVRAENAELRQHVASTDEELGGARDQLAKSKRRRDAHLRANTRMKERMPLVGSRDLLMDYEKRKAVIYNYRTRLVQLTDRHKELTDSIKKEESTIVSLQHELSHYPK
ncbi:conserved hypothetical protein [Leishmania major strain Friedlin]|uniref:CCDC113/CCDC96 coiled-coil domain-containing protein n=1 Tax=Leishmania major TaxID=5664 RepID=Q4QFW4_LEIMA|nr:conserved hypothetical protein [Leishmania major strain Friedlin]CAG9571203.1 Domain_of_unknown_function_(DUF4201)_-_putative [Leishmania major strain Friedlin]CAJ02665.1 conserved hypothetical protein [Leishmania major strain Friedlin]|eukprot:XP_001687620.1 conserved hypothetical protein [Leishmania major strain Friedlin]